MKDYCRQFERDIQRIPVFISYDTYDRNLDIKRNFSTLNYKYALNALECTCENKRLFLCCADPQCLKTSEKSRLFRKYFPFLDLLAKFAICSKNVRSDTYNITEETETFFDGC